MECLRRINYYHTSWHGGTVSTGFCRVLATSERSKLEVTLPIKLTVSHVRFIIASFDWPTFYFRFDRASAKPCTVVNLLYSERRAPP